MPFLAALLLARTTLGRTTLADYLAGHPPQEPWVAVDAERVVAENPAGLDAFDRKAVRVGGLTAIVPRTMVVFHDPTGTPPNLVEGLPLETKLLALLATLDAPQWRRLNGDGVGMADLPHAQQALYASLLPHPFRWISGESSENRFLPPSEAAKVRLRLRRKIVLGFFSPDGRLATRQATPSPPSEPIDAGASLDGAASLDTLYGVRLRETVPIAEKKGDLRFEPLTNAMQARGTVRAPAWRSSADARSSPTPASPSCPSPAQARPERAISFGRSRSRSAEPTGRSVPDSCWPPISKAKACWPYASDFGEVRPNWRPDPRPRVGERRSAHKAAPFGSATLPTTRSLPTTPSPPASGRRTRPRPSEFASSTFLSLIATLSIALKPNRRVFGVPSETRARSRSFRRSTRR